MRRAAVLAVAVLAGCGSEGGDDDGGGSGKVVWDTKPRIVKVAALPDDRVLSGTLRNDSFGKVELAQKDIRLEDAKGRAVPHTTVFLSSYGRDIYPPRYRHKLSREDELRLGRRVKLEAGQRNPVTIAWRVKDPNRRPVRVELPQGELVVPKS